jgi:hypothetical protein
MKRAVPAKRKPAVKRKAGLCAICSNDWDNWMVPTAGSILHMLPSSYRKASAVLQIAQRMLDAEFEHARRTRRVKIA